MNPEEILEIADQLLGRYRRLEDSHALDVFAGSYLVAERLDVMLNLLDRIACSLDGIVSSLDWIETATAWEGVVAPRPPGVEA